MNITKVVFTEIDGTTQETVSTTSGFTTAVATLTDGSQATVFPVSGVPVVAPTDTEVDVLLSDGTTKTFVPKV